MLRKLSFLALLLLAAISSAPAYEQEQQPSLADVARQARKDKEKNTTTPKTVITEDSLPAGKADGGLGLSDLGEAKASGGPNAAGDTNGVAEGWAGLERAEAALNKIEPMDRSTLAKAALQSNDVDFPNRRNWEDKLFSAKRGYVSHSRELLQEMKQVLAAAQSMQASQSGSGKSGPDDPAAQDLIGKTQEILQDATRTESAFKAIIQEGQELAKQAKAR